MNNAASNIAFITGSTRSIGLAIATELVRQNWTVIINSRCASKESEEALQQLRSDAGKAEYLPGDMRDEAKVMAIFSKIRSSYGPLKLLVNNVGSGTKGAWLEASKAAWLEALEWNLLSAVLCSAQAAKLMAAQDGGQIINVASIRGLEHSGHPLMLPYSVAKAALISFTKTAAKTLAPRVRMNAIAPGAVQSADSYGSKTAPGSHYHDTLLEQKTTAQDVAQGVVYLAHSSAITGEVLVVDGGFNLK
jgi:3-oxoacyl-[acyl-carrier protein] reductase